MSFCGNALRVSCNRCFDFRKDSDRRYRAIQLSSTVPEGWWGTSSAATILIKTVLFAAALPLLPAYYMPVSRQIRGAEAFQIPIIVTEQYPKALGATVTELLEVLPASAKPIAKTDFTMMGMILCFLVAPAVNIFTLQY
jgi:hypothetical protein